jgi:hypothetical protein
VENASFPASAVVDGNTSTRWSSAFATQGLSVSGTGRYVRMYGTARATPYGYSLWEFGVHTTGGAGPTPTPTPTSPGTGAPPASFCGNTSAIPRPPTSWSSRS